jgi:predicted dehydrogenase
MPRDIALVGSGAIAQLFYLPAIARNRDTFGEVWLVDPNERAIAAGTSIVAGKTAAALSAVPNNVKLVVIATPNNLHLPVAHEALARGAHVLIEKPFVLWPEEARNIVQMARTTGQIIAVNQTRRFIPYARDLRQRVQTGEFGLLKSVVHHEGYKLVWPFETGAAFHKAAQRTGVIMDLGVHVIDFYEFLFHPNWNLVSATHDGFRGPEGLAEIELEANGARMSIRLSRYEQQDNVARITFENAEIAINVGGLNMNTYTITDNSGSTRHVTASPSVESYNALADQVLANFLASVAGQSDPICSASSSVPVIDLLDEVYRSARHYPDAVGGI